MRAFPRGLALVLLLLAATALLAQPVCAASEPLPGVSQDCGKSHHDPQGEHCCAELEAIVGAPPDPGATSRLPPLFVDTWSPTSRTATLPAASAGRLSALSPPRLLPYHARSARILR